MARSTLRVMRRFSSTLEPTNVFPYSVAGCIACLASKRTRWSRLTNSSSEWQCWQGCWHQEVRESHPNPCTVNIDEQGYQEHEGLGDIGSTGVLRPHLHFLREAGTLVESKTGNVMIELAS